MAHFFRGCSFKKIEDVEMGCREFLPQRTRCGTLRGIELLAERWVQPTESNALYFEEYSSFVVVI
jgi:hypothetical protein